MRLRHIGISLAVLGLAVAAPAAPPKQEAPQQSKRKQPQVAALLGGKLKRA